ncbi:hypothetical protein B0H19DRAFT_1237004 [Mycena capillaripes]|nr:hypothetical protein B0H19DRAFT_1237004 [Mycena capillaripes]
MAQNYLLLMESADHIVWDSGTWHRNPKLYATVTLDLDDNPVSRTPVFKRSLQPKWNFSSNLLCALTSTITLRLYHSTFIPRRADPLLGECKIGIEELLHRCGSGSVVRLSVAAKGKVSGRLSMRLQRSEDAAKNAKDRMQKTVGILSPVGSGFGEVDAAVEARAAQNDLATALGACIDRLQVFVNMGDKIAQAVKEQREMDKEVVGLVKTMVEVYSFKEDVNFVPEKIKILEDSLIKITQQTLACANFLEEYRQHIFSGRAIRTTFLNNNRKRIDDLSEELVKLRESFTYALNTQTLFHTTEIHGTVKKMAHRMNPDQSGALEKLRHISYDVSLRSECLPGTREDILDDISKWLTIPSDTSNILWLSGVAGSGKSSIATSLSQRFRDQDCLVIEQKPGIVDAPIRRQFEALLRGPLVSVQPYMEKSIVIILDALDECSDNNWRATLISLITDGFPTLPVVFRFLITSRPDVDISGQFHAQHNITAQTLGMSTAKTEGDVTFYIQWRLERIRTQDHNIPREWPGAFAINQLAEHSGGLFIWASTACNFIQGFDPQERLEKLLARDFRDESRLDEIYTIALQNSAPWTSDDHFAVKARGILGCIVLSRAPLNDKTMDSLLFFKPGTASKVLAYLGCVIHRTSDKTARVLHASFSDYLMDSDRSASLSSIFVAFKTPIS